MTKDLRFPIGKFNPPEHIDSALIVEWISDIENCPKAMREAVEGLTDEQLDTTYRPGGWTLRQVVHHVPDSHINSYMRFHWTLTEDSPRIKAYDEKIWAELEYQKSMPIAVSLNLLDMVHQRWVFLLKSLSETDLEKYFVHPENGQNHTLKWTIALYAWHSKHHVAHITDLKKRMGW